MNTNVQKTLAARAAIVGTALAAFSALPCAVSATTIYQDNFRGSKTAALNGTAPTIDNGPSGTTWTADSSWSDSGYSTNGNRVSAYLPFTPSNGHIYDLSAGLNLVGEGINSGSPDANYWVALGFLTALSTNTGWDSSGASPWVMSRYNASGAAALSGPGFNGVTWLSDTTGVNTWSIVLDTMSSAWTYKVYETNSAATDSLVASGAFSSNPAISAVGIQNGYGDAQVSDFSLTDQPVPEPATLGLFGLGGLALLLASRKRKAVV